MNTSKMTLGTRMLTAFGVVILLMVGIALFGISQLSSVNDQVATLADENLPKLDKSYRWVVSVLQCSRHMRNVFLLSTKEEVRQELVGIHDTKLERQQLLNEMTKLVVSPEEKEALEAVVRVRAAYIVDEDEFLRLAEAGDLDRAKTLMLDRARPKQLAYIAAVSKFITIQEAAAKHQEATAAETYKRGRTVFLGFSALIAAVALAIGTFVSRGVTRELTAAIQHLQSSSSELQTAAGQQASGAKEQSSSTSEVSTTLRELVATSRQIGESAQRVAALAEESRQEAKAGDVTGNLAQDAVTATKRQVDLIVHHMLDLGKKSQQIGGVLDIVNELSEQTNILSINATIEAAGAGEAGARFSAVAEEIRKLADRTGSSTKEIRTLVEEIRAGVNTTVMVTEGGSKAAEAAAKQISEVVVALGKIAETVVVTAQAGQEIELSTRQQVSAVEQVDQAVAQVAQATREAEASTAQTMQAAAQLSTLAKDLTKLVRSDAGHADGR